MYLFPRLLKQLPLDGAWRLCALSSLLCLVVLMSGLLVPFHQIALSLLIISVASLAWYFHLPFPYLCVGGVICALLLFLIWMMTLFWPRLLPLNVLLEIASFFLAAFVVSCIRTAFNAVQLAHHKTELAEQQLALAAARHQRLNDLKDQFLLNVSHELRTPLTEVKGYLELLRENYPQLDADSAANFLDHACHGCGELESLIDNILEATQLDISISSADIAVISLAEIAQGVIDRLDSQQHEIQLDISDDLAARASRQQLERVLHNLLSNAIKYSPADTRITVSATLISNRLPACPDICIRVQDMGEGVPAADMPMLFQKVMRLKRDMTGSVRGTGLGLFICKHLVETMGGRIWVESTGVPGQGSCFCFTLPGVPITLLPLSLTT
ncbi:sensor histidine kinase [Dictyobacter halimunensis]